MKKMTQLFLGILCCFMLSGCVVQVEDGQVGVKNDFGHIRDEVLNAGWHFFVPAVTQIELWNVKLQELKEMAYVPSSEGLISQLDISIMYLVPADKASFVRKSIGPYYVSVVLEPYVREAIRNVASGYAVKALYSEAGRKDIGKNILDFLKGKLDSKGIIIQDVLLRDVKLPPSFSQSIELKLKAEQEALQKEFELQKAKKDAELANNYKIRAEKAEKVKPPIESKPNDPQLSDELKLIARGLSDEEIEQAKVTIRKYMALEHNRTEILKAQKQIQGYSSLKGSDEDKSAMVMSKIEAEARKVLVQSQPSPQLTVLIPEAEAGTYSLNHGQPDPHIAVLVQEVEAGAGVVQSHPGPRLAVGVNKDELVGLYLFGHGRSRSHAGRHNQRGG